MESSLRSQLCLDCAVHMPTVCLGRQLQVNIVTSTTLYTMQSTFVQISGAIVHKLYFLFFIILIYYTSSFAPSPLSGLDCCWSKVQNACNCQYTNALDFIIII